MTIIVGMIVVVGAVLGGFTMAGGHIHSLIHPPPSWSRWGARRWAP